jgi:integrase
LPYWKNNRTVREQARIFVTRATWQRVAFIVYCERLNQKYKLVGDSLRATFERVRKEAGLPNLRLHDASHFFASACVASGVDFMTISKWLGHGDGGMLLGRVYGHISNEHAQRAAKKVIFGNGGRGVR